MGDILIICENDEGKIKGYSNELAYKASEIAGQLGCQLHAVVFGESVKDSASELGKYGVNKVTVVTGATVIEYNSDIYVANAAKVIEEIKPQYIFATASDIGRDLLPRLAVRLSAGMATECTDLINEDGDFRFRRPVYAGKALVDVKILSDAKFATVRPNIFTIGDLKETTADVVTMEALSVDPKVKMREKVQSESKEVDVVEANVIVSGGRAVGNADNFKMLRELAKQLNASIGASRAAVDAGYISHDHQVGQTGKTVNPTLYFACGISGAIQHLAGMKTSKIIIAINKDPDAPIFTKADFGIVGDIFKVVPAVTEKLKKLQT